MKKILLAATVVIAFIIYAIHKNTEGVSVGLSQGIPQITPMPSQGDTSNTPVSTAQQQNVASRYKDGQFVGSSENVFYGNVQVKAIIQGGKIINVQFLEYPNDRRESQQISNASMPLLTQEAIQVQSEKVDIISGATQTSEGFIQSLRSALDKAKV